MMGGYGRGLGSGYDMMGGGWLGTGLFLFFGLLVLAGIAVLVIWAVRSTSGGHHPSAGTPRTPSHDEAVAILRKRFAAGEITKEQFDEGMRALSGTP